MSTEGVEGVRRAYDGLNRGQNNGEDLRRSIRETCHPDIVLEMGLLEGTFHGHEGFALFVEGQTAIIDGLRADPEEFIEVGDHVVVPFRLSGRARNTEIPVEYHYVHVWTLHDGKVSHLKLYGSKESALRDLTSLEQ